jgi:hypothetical protein
MIEESPKQRKAPSMMVLSLSDEEEESLLIA